MNSSPQFIEIYLKPAREILLENGSAKKYQDFLLQQYQQNPNGAVALELLRSYKVNDQHSVLMEFLKQALQQTPSLELFDFALEYFNSYPQQRDDAWADLTRYFKNINNKRMSYQCSVCGYSSQGMHWNCPSCKTWSSIRPINNGSL